MAAVLIVGSSGGLGKALEEVYRAEGWQAEGLTRASCDLSDPVSVKRWTDGLEERNPAWDLCIFAAGVSEAGFADAMDQEAFRRCLEVNFFASLTLFYRLVDLPRPCRSYVFILSGASDLLVPGLAPYALSKRMMRDWLHTVSVEKSFEECRFLEVWPGPLDTDFDRKTHVHGDYVLPKGARRKDPRVVARKIFESQKRGNQKLILSPLTRLAGFMQAACPPLIDAWLRHDQRFRRDRVRLSSQRRLS